jgi:hypothetical protein
VGGGTGEVAVERVRREPRVRSLLRLSGVSHASCCVQVSVPAAPDQGLRRSQGRIHTRTRISHRYSGTRDSHAGDDG